MKKIIALALLITLSFNLMACNHDSNPLSSYSSEYNDKQKDFVPLYEAAFDIQFYLDPDSIDISTEDQLFFTKNKSSSYEISYKINFDDIPTSTLILDAKAPVWLKLEANPNEVGQYTLSGTVPQKYSTSKQGQALEVQMTIIPDPNTDEKIMQRLQYFDLSKTITVFIDEPLSTLEEK